MISNYMTDYVTFDQFNSQLILIHQTMHDNQKDGFVQLHSISKDVGRIATSVEKMQAEQSAKIEQHNTRLTAVEKASATNNEHRIKAGTWMIMAGVVATAGLGAVVKFVFFT